MQQPVQFGNREAVEEFALLAHFVGPGTVGGHGGRGEGRGKRGEGRGVRGEE
jgi:hypothetical protein